MAPNLQGLNIVHLPAQDSDSQDLLPSAYPDISAQLALWTDLPFDSDDSPVMHSGSSGHYSRKDDEDDEEEERERARDGKSAAVHHDHVNVVTGTTVPNMQSAATQPTFDLNALLAGFGGDYAQLFQQQQLQQQQQQQQQHVQPPSTISPSLAQLLLYSAQNGNQLPPPPANVESSRAPSEDAPPSKRARTRKASISLSVADSPTDSSLSPLSQAEDKRRRNTAASARFRMKKKEREAALEGKAKELETKVSELERECEGLRRENGWLKGLVVGVTGAAQGTAIPAKRGRDDDA